MDITAIPTMKMLATGVFWFWVAACVMSLFFGFFRSTYFSSSGAENKRTLGLVVSPILVELHWFVCGRVALWFLGRKVMACLDPSCVEPTFWDVVTFFLAFVGVTGFLPLPL